MKIFKIAFIFILGLTIFCTVGTIQANASTINVCPVGSIDPNCNYFGGNGIRDGINAAQPGDTIFLKNGLYQNTQTSAVNADGAVGNAAYSISKNINIVGESRCAVIIDGSLNTNDPDGFFISSNANVNISSLTITGFNKAGYSNAITSADTSVVTIDDVKLFGNSNGAGSYSGSNVNPGSMMIIKNSYVTQNTNTGLWIFQGSNMQVINTLIDNNARGIDLWDYAKLTVNSTYIINNNLQGNLTDKFGIVCNSVGTSIDNGSNSVYFSNNQGGNLMTYNGGCAGTTEQSLIVNNNANIPTFSCNLSSSSISNISSSNSNNSSATMSSKLISSNKTSAFVLPSTSVDDDKSSVLPFLFILSIFTAFLVYNITRHNPNSNKINFDKVFNE